MFGHHVLRREQRLPGPPEDVFGFFADAGNLEAITPDWLAFRIVTPRPIAMRVGAPGAMPSKVEDILRSGGEELCDQSS